MEREVKRVKNGKLYMIPASEETRGHGTTCMAKFWKEQLQEFVATAPRRPAACHSDSHPSCASQ